MSRNLDFPGRTVITSFLSCEKTLARVLDVVPWCHDHESVWSPVLTTVIMEACTQLDSLWGYDAWQSECVRKKKKRTQLNIKDYFEYFGSIVSKRWVVFWGGDPVSVHPFESWRDQADFSNLAWWDVYNKLKHDRLEHKEMANLSTAVNALAGLFLAILACEHCRYAVEAAGWLSAAESVSHNPKASLGEDSTSIKDNYVLAETILFSYPVGWCNSEINQGDDWRGDASFRFKQWFSDYPGV